MLDRTRTGRSVERMRREREQLEEAQLAEAKKRAGALVTSNGWQAVTNIVAVVVGGILGNELGCVVPGIVGAVAALILTQGVFRLVVGHHLGAVRKEAELEGLKKRQKERARLAELETQNQALKQSAE